MKFRLVYIDDILKFLVLLINKYLLILLKLKTKVELTESLVSDIESSTPQNIERFLNAVDDFQTSMPYRSMIYKSK